MTICIAALCDEGKVIVVASDRMVTSSRPALQFDRKTRKIIEFHDRCVIMSAGDALAHTEVVTRAHDVLAVETDPHVDKMTETIREIYQARRRERAERLHLRPRGITLESFYGGQILRLPPELGLVIDKHIAHESFNLDLIVAGIDSTGGHIYGIADPGESDCYDSIGFHAIGSGVEHAITMLALNYRPDIKQEEMTRQIYEVKKTAQVAPGVGEATDISVITDKGIKRIDITKLEKPKEGGKRE